MTNMDDILTYTQTLNVLYVEDNEEAREMTLMVFEDFFHTIVAASDGEDGLEKFKKNNFDLLITDVNMPKLTGPQMIMKIREIDKDIPILLFSAYNESDLNMENIKAEISAYLLKPIDIEQFFDTLKKVLQNKLF